MNIIKHENIQHGKGLINFNNNLKPTKNYAKLPKMLRIKCLITQEREEYEQQEEVRRKAMEAEMARLEKEARERERQRQLAETKEIQKKHALERIEQLKKSELGARVVQKIDEEVSTLV